jgi:monofunctional glycosyltransferase
MTRALRTRRSTAARRPLRALILAALAALGAWVAWEVRTWPDVSALARSTPSSTAFIDRYHAEQRAAGREGRPAWTWVPYAAISPHLKRAVVVAEDITFFSHRGFEPAEMRDALARALEDRELPRGASTISQQLAKNLWLSPSRNPLRKLREAMLTRQLERALDKRRILELYLNVAEFGPGVYGAEAASRRYFGKPAASLGEAEAARLAASLPAPRHWHPGAGSRTAEQQAERIRRRMTRAQFLWKHI